MGVTGRGYCLDYFTYEEFFASCLPVLVRYFEGIFSGIFVLTRCVFRRISSPSWWRHMTFILR